MKKRRPKWPPASRGWVIEMGYWLAFVGDGLEFVTYSKLTTKDNLIEWLLGGFSADNWVGPASTKRECRQLVEAAIASQGISWSD